MTLREGTASDREAVLRIRPQAAALLGDGEGSYLLVAEEAGVLLGCASVCRREIPAPGGKIEAFINLIEVFEERNHRRGIASAMVQQVVNVERNRATYQIRCYVDIHNIASHRLWIHNGFGIAPVKVGEAIVGSYATYVLEGR